MTVTDILNSVVVFDKEAVVENVTTAINNGISIDDILNKGLIKAMDVVGEKFSSGEIFVPEMLQAAKAMQLGLEILKPHLAGDALMEKGTVVIGTVKGDLHDIGKNIVSLVLRNFGYSVIDLGKNIAAETIITKAIKEKADLIGLSALMTTTLDEMHKVIKLTKAQAPAIKVIVGGAAVSASFAKEIGADAYGKDALDAVRKIKNIKPH